MILEVFDYGVGDRFIPSVASGWERRGGWGDSFKFPNCLGKLSWAENLMVA